MSQSLTTAPVVADRNAAFERVFNFRDLGGYLAGGNRTIRWGRLYRSDGLQHVTDHDLETLGGLGVRSIVDLRTRVEVVERGSFPVDRHPLDHHHLPLLRRTWEDDPHLVTPTEPELTAAFLTARYVEMLADGGPALAGVIAILARAQTYPAVFHCAVGKDRTGVVAAMVLDLLGVGHDLIVHDYTLSALGMARIEQWLAANAPEEAAAWDLQPTAWLASPPAAMACFLEHLDAEHGGAEGYLRARGVPASTIDAVRGNLLR
ncbi:MAG: tyrosine-protein phosphatase [Acidimicrobiales bacterium]|nr:tyrosine-protein phosphatase [Acidimicrobiales bacterium]